MRTIIHEIYRFIPPRGQPAQPILLFGMQEYSPRQIQRCHFWQFKVPQTYGHLIPDGTQCLSFAQARSVLACCFLDGRDADFSKHIVAENHRAKGSDRF